MSLSVFALVLMAAALHAGWNAVVKRAGDKLVVAVAICVAAALIAGMILPFVAQPARASWPFIGLSVGLQTVYYVLVAATYRRADMGQAYPLMRGTAPMIVALASGLVFAEALPAAGWAGVAMISAGILALALPAGWWRGRWTVPAGGAGSGFALATALVIAAYTIGDGLGVRRSGAAPGYTLWIFLLTAPPVLGWSLWCRGRAFPAAVVARWRDGLSGALGTMISYGIALWAMTQAPVAMVAALRETSILFAIAISALVLGEGIGPRRITAAVAIALGAAVLRLA